MEEDGLEMMGSDDHFEGGEINENYKEVEIREQDRYK